MQHAEDAFCSLLDWDSASSEAVAHRGRFNGVSIKRENIQSLISKSLPQAYTQAALLWRRLRQCARAFVGARRSGGASSLGALWESVLGRLVAAAECEGLERPCAAGGGDEAGDAAAVEQRVRQPLAEIVGRLRWGSLSDADQALADIECGARWAHLQAVRGAASRWKTFVRKAFDEGGSLAFALIKGPRPSAPLRFLRVGRRQDAERWRRRCEAGYPSGGGRRR